MYCRPNTSVYSQSPTKNSTVYSIMLFYAIVNFSIKEGVFIFDLSTINIDDMWYKEYIIVVGYANNSGSLRDVILFIP